MDCEPRYTGTPASIPASLARNLPVWWMFFDCAQAQKSSRL